MIIRTELFTPYIDGGDEFFGRYLDGHIDIYKTYGDKYKGDHFRHTEPMTDEELWRYLPRQYKNSINYVDRQKFDLCKIWTMEAVEAHIAAGMIRPQNIYVLRQNCEKILFTFYDDDTHYKEIDAYRWKENRIHLNSGNPDSWRNEIFRNVGHMAGLTLTYDSGKKELTFRSGFLEKTYDIKPAANMGGPGYFAIANTHSEKSRIGFIWQEVFNDMYCARINKNFVRKFAKGFAEDIDDLLDGEGERARWDERGIKWVRSVVLNALSDFRIKDTMAFDVSCHLEAYLEQLYNPCNCKTNEDKLTKWASSGLQKMMSALKEKKRLGLLFAKQNSITA